MKPGEYYVYTEDENLRETFGTPEVYNTIFNELKGSDRPLTLKEFISRKNEFQDQTENTRYHP